MKVLLCIDDDPLLEEVLGTLRWCVRSVDDRQVVVVHVTPVFDWMRRETGWAPWIRAEEEKTTRLLSRASDYVSSLGDSGDTLGAEGGVVPQILRVASERSADLIVIGALGRQGPGFLIGSVSQKVKELAPTDVLVVRPGSPREGERWRALVAVDGSDDSLAAVASLVRTTNVRTADVRLVHVVEVPLTVWDLGSGEIGSATDVSALSSSVRARADLALSAAQALLRNHGIEAETEIRTGAPATEILAAATAHRAHLIAMGSRGLSRIQGALLGSVTQRVVRHGTTTVLVVRSGSV